MEQAMSTMNLDITVRRGGALSRAALIGGAAIVIVIGLPTAKYWLSDAAKASITAGQPVAAQAVAAPEPATFAIVPAAVIETNPQFFFGTGDGSGGYYSERPIE